MIFSISAAILYLLTVLTIVPKLFHKTGPNRLLVQLFSLLAVASHAIALWHETILPTGQNFSLINVNAMVQLLIALAFSLQSNRNKLLLIAPIVYAIAAISVLLLMINETAQLKHISNDLHVIFHIGVSLLCYSILMIALMYAVVLQWLKSRLKSKKLLLPPSLPPLLSIEKQFYHLTFVGWSLLTFSLISGGVFIDELFAQGIGHKMVLSFIAWIVYLRLLYVHLRSGCTIKQNIIYSVLGSALLSLAYFGARIVKELIIN